MQTRTIEAPTRQDVNPGLKAHIGWWQTQGCPRADYLTEDQSQDVKYSLERRLAGLRNYLRSLQQFPLLPAGTINNQVEFLDKKGGFDSLFRDILSRVSSSTAVLVPYRELGIADKLSTGLRVTSYGSVPIHWAQEDLLSAGTYSRKRREINIKRGLPTTRELLVSLGDFGYLNGSLEYIGHEILHALQHYLSDQSPANQTEEARITREVQAYRTIGSLPYRSSDFVAATIGNSKRDNGTQAYEYATRQQIDEAVWALDRLDALGFSPRQIAFLIGNIDWNDRENGVFKTLGQIISKRAEYLGLTEQSLETLVNIQHREKQADRLMSRSLTLDRLAMHLNV